MSEEQDDKNKKPDTKDLDSKKDPKGGGTIKPVTPPPGGPTTQPNPSGG